VTVALFGQLIGK